MRGKLGPHVSCCIESVRLHVCVDSQLASARSLTRSGLRGLRRHASGIKCLISLSSNKECIDFSVSSSSILACQYNDEDQIDSQWIPTPIQ
jgi:hypothetical protein